MPGKKIRHRHRRHEQREFHERVGHLDFQKGNHDRPVSRVQCGRRSPTTSKSGRSRPRARRPAPRQPMKLRLTARIVLFFGLLAAALLAAVGVFSYRAGSKSLEAAAVAEMQAKAVEKEAALDVWMEERTEDIRRFTSYPDVTPTAAALIAAAPNSKAARSARAMLLRELNPHLAGTRAAFTEIFVMDPASGIVVASTTPAEEGKSKVGHPYFDEGKSRLHVQGPYLSVDFDAPAATGAVPLRAM